MTFKRRQYKDRSANRIYNGYVDLWLRGPTGKRDELWMETGQPRYGGATRIAFWHGFGVRLAPRHTPNSWGSAIYAAGKDCRKHAERCAEHRREMEMNERGPGLGAPVTDLRARP